MKTSSSSFSIEQGKLILSVSTTGLLYAKPNDCSPLNNLTVDFSKSPVSQTSSIPPSTLKPATGWVESSEPDEHLKYIAENLCSVDPQQKHSLYCAFSYKDIPLFTEIAKLRPGIQVEVLFGPNSITGLYPEDLTSVQVVETLNRHYRGQSLLFRHYLEHYDMPNSILTAIQQNIDPDSILYIEVPDCSWFFDNASPLFAWEHHKVYFNNNSLNSLLATSSLNSIFNEILGDTIEPSICLIAKVASSSKSPHSSSNLEICNSNADVHLPLSRFSTYIKVWNDFFLCNDFDFMLYGISHNSDRFLQVTCSQSYFSAFLDDTSAKFGKYLAFSDIAISSYSLSNNTDKPLCIILGMHPRHHQSVKKRILEDSTVRNISVKSIFSTPV